MSDPVWVTPAGSLGDITSQKLITPINLSATPVYPASTVFYKIYSGSLPNGLSLSILGVISGSANFVNADTIFGFTVQVYDNLGNSALRDFFITVKNPNPLWVTPSFYDLNGRQVTDTSIYNNVNWNLGTFPLDLALNDIVIQARAPAISATSLTGGSHYTILSLNSGVNPANATNFTLIGAPNNNIGTQFVATSAGTGTGTAYPSYPSTKLTYKIISGNLPTGVSLVNDVENNIAILTGTPNVDVQSETYTFVVRCTDNNNYISDRTFSMTVSGSLTPYFVTAAGALPATFDSIWYTQQIEFVNPAESLYPATIALASGSLPPGLEINEAGLIRGYPSIPVINEFYEQIDTVIIKTTYGKNTLTALSTVGFKVGRPIRFSGVVFGGVTEFNPISPNDTTYYVKKIVSNSEFTISTTIGGAEFIVSNGTGVMDATLPDNTEVTPINKNYNFTLRIDSELGNILRNFSIQVNNQNLVNGFGNIRTPVIYNTRPFTYNIDQDVANYGFYVLPEGSIITGDTYPLTTYAPIGKYFADNYFTFKILGYDFDSDTIEYLFSFPVDPDTELDTQLIGDSNTGWISGHINVPAETIYKYNFSVRVRKAANPSIISPAYNFSILVTNEIDNRVIWISDASLGNIFNGTTSVLRVEAENASVPLLYELTSGTLPNNLILLSNGNIVGNVAYETTNDYVAKNVSVPYTFTVNAYSEDFKLNVQKEKEFTINVVQKFIEPTESLYMKCTPSIADRELIYNLLNNTELIPNNYLYRSEDSNFGKANNVTYVHAYGIKASSLAEYIAAVEIQHYNRNITLGPLKTAIARNEKNEIIYEVVYSEIIDNLVNPQGISVSKEINWPTWIDLHLGPWYTSITDIYTSYIYPFQLDILTQDKIFWLSTQDDLVLTANQGQPTFYTSLTPGYARLLYPNSLENMRKQVEDTLGVDNSAALLPLWMSSQQLDGSTLGFTRAWVIAFCEARILVDGQPITYAEFEAQKDDNGWVRSNYKSYAEQIAYNITNNWVDEVGDTISLNMVDFQLDRFTVNKSLTYDYDKAFDPGAWTDLPSGVPQPNPINSKDFQVLFPRKTILPNKTAYPKA